MISVGATHHTRIVPDPIQSVKVAFLLPAHPGAPQIELVQPFGERSPVRRFLEAGGGLHHVCYEVPDIEAQLKFIQAQGAVLIRRPRPAVALENRLIAWVITRDKLLIEYLEIPVPRSATM